MTVIPIFFTFNRHYLLPAAVAFHSLLKQADKRYFYRLYVLHTSLGRADCEQLFRITKAFDNASLEFIDMTEWDCDASLLQGKSHFSQEIYYKLAGADLFPQYDRILCSDVDVVFTGDISPSYFMYPEENFYYAGVGQILASNRMQHYGDRFTTDELQILEKEIAAGYLLLNLSYIRRQKMQQQMTRYYKENYHRFYLPEQDCMMLCCWPEVRFLPMEYVVCNIYYRTPAEKACFNQRSGWLPADDEQCRQMYRQALARPIQLHFVGADKPWNQPWVPQSRIWFSELKESGLCMAYLRDLPLFVRQKIGRYSFRRFLRKLINRLR